MPFGLLWGIRAELVIALWRLSEADFQRERLPLSVKFWNFCVQALCALITTSSGFTQNLLDSISSDAQGNIERHFAGVKQQGHGKKVKPTDFLSET